MNGNELPTTSAAPAHEPAHDDAPTPSTARHLLASIRKRATSWLFKFEMNSYAASASALAGAAGRHVVSIDDLAMVCLAGGVPLHVLSNSGIDGLDLRREIDATLKALPAGADRVGTDVHEGKTRTAWDRAWLRANARARDDGATAVDDRALLLACLREPICVTRDVLATRGWPARRLALALAGVDDAVSDTPLQTQPKRSTSSSAMTASRLSIGCAASFNMRSPCRMRSRTLSPMKS